MPVRARSPRPLALGAALTLALPLAVALTVGSDSARAADDAGWCSTRPTPCIVSVSRDGAPVLANDPSWDVTLVPDPSGASFDVRRTSGGDVLDRGEPERDHVWSITLDTGTIVPRVAFGYARDFVVTRSRIGATHRVTLTGEPVRVTDNAECATGSWPWVCPERALDERTGYFAGGITDYASWTDVAQRESMYGMDLSTNVAVSSIPPEIVVDSSTGAEQLLLRLANQHEFPDGTLFKGFAKVRIPNTFLREVYGIDDPASLTSSGLSATAGSGTTKVTQESGDDAMLVEATGMTFSTRTLTVRRGTVVPTRPKKVTAKRVSPHRARIGYKKARARGSAITGYAVRCDAVRSRHVARTIDKAPKTRIDRLVINKAYRCKVRAKSEAGPSKWSKKVKVKARPKYGRR